MVIKIDKITSLWFLHYPRGVGEYKQLIDRYISKVITECGVFYIGYTQGKLMENSGGGDGKDVL